MTRTLLVLTIAAAAVPALTGAADAAPKKAETFPLVCDDGHSYIATSNGNGDFTSARDTASTAVFVPHAFGPFTGEIRDDHGVLVDSFTDPAMTQGSGKQKSTISCTFSITEVSDGSDPEFPAGWTFTGSGTVTGVKTGK